jgi:UDP-glucose 4-epimerase
VVAIFVERLMGGKDIELHGDGEQVRDFVFVDDVVRAVEATLVSDEDLLWNVCSGVPVSISELLAMLITLTGANPRISRLPPREGDVRRSLLARGAQFPFAGEPTTLEQGLRMMLSTAAPAANDGERLVSA